MKLPGFRNARGAMLGFIVSGTFFFVVLAIAIVQISMLVSGSREVANAVDSGTLNAGKKAVQLTTGTQGFDESQFSDLKDDDGEFGLTNINRVWGKALLARMNAKAMKDAGQSTGTSDSHADSLFSAAESISDRVADKLKDAKNLHPFFTELAAKNSIRMLGNTATVQVDAGNGWDTSLMDRGEETNIIVTDGQLPDGFNINDSKMFKQAEDNKVHIKGYTDIQVMNKSICFVPFKVKQQPHLISEKTFKENTLANKPFPAWKNPVPNAISCQGETKSQRLDQQHARSFVLTNPQKNFDLAMPHTFMKVKFEDNTAHWYINGIPAPNSSYDFHTDVQKREYPCGTGTLTVTATLGNEYMPPTVGKGIFALPGGDYDPVTHALLQRCREIKHDFTESDLDQMLMMCPIIGTQEFVIFPDPNGTLRCTPKSLAQGLAPWIDTSKEADGKEEEIVSDETWFIPNFVIAIPKGLGAKPLPSWCVTYGSLKWKPGTGYDGCLGELRIERETDIFANGVCTLF